ncbi:hypothetical protein B5X24_HaOG212232 [Helicoverpa armigera]|uniref:Uncharacterized protein n=1 Tax=Helicoverpa armigera TaxID=29058 RepID=A0A2W1B888_HELAM|nr:hypothetical protein B5X24_HaOG212232 [Helicoverpa armigera]
MLLHHPFPLPFVVVVVVVETGFLGGFVEVATKQHFSNVRNLQKTTPKTPTLHHFLCVFAGKKKWRNKLPSKTDGIKSFIVVVKYSLYFVASFEDIKLVSPTLL